MIVSTIIGELGTTTSAKALVRTHILLNGHNTDLPIGDLLAQKLKEAIPNAAKHADVFNTICDTLSPDTVKAWLQIIDDWQEDPEKAECPYMEPVSSM